MAKQKGLFKVEGTLDDVTFYKKGDTFFIRNKGGVTKERFLTDPSFARTRENGSEFANVAASGKMIRNANAVLIKKAKDGSLTRRLMHVLAKVKNADTVSVRGKRNVYEGNRTAAVAWRSKTLAALIDHSALGGAGVRTARFGERSEYEGSRTPASPSAFREETTINACSD